MIEFSSSHGFSFKISYDFVWLVRLRRESTHVNKTSYAFSGHFEADCLIKLVGGQIIRLKYG